MDLKNKFEIEWKKLIKEVFFTTGVSNKLPAIIPISFCEELSKNSCKQCNGKGFFEINRNVIYRNSKTQEKTNKPEKVISICTCVEKKFKKMDDSKKIEFFKRIKDHYFKAYEEEFESKNR